MKRREFLSGLFGAGTGLIMPIGNNESKTKTYTFDEIFHRPYENHRLIFLKQDSEIYKTIKESINDRILPESKFSAYLPDHNVLLEIKDHYTIDDFKPFMASLNNVYHHNDRYCEWSNGVFFRLIDDSDLPLGVKDWMHIDLFLAR